VFGVRGVREGFQGVLISGLCLIGLVARFGLSCRCMRKQASEKRRLRSWGCPKGLNDSAMDTQVLDYDHVSDSGGVQPGSHAAPGL